MTPLFAGVFKNIRLFMNRLLSIALAALLTTTLLSAQRGDVNRDGTVNVNDVTTLVNMILGAIPVDIVHADVNGDGNVNVSDVTALVNIILGTS